MKSRWLCTLLAMFVMQLGPQAVAGTWTLDKEHTAVTFSWDHLGLSRQSGRFLDVSGTANFDPGRPEAASVQVNIPIASLSTGVAKLDEHLLKTKDFFDVDKFPNIAFSSSQVRFTSDRTLDIVGDLTINGVTHAVTLNVIFNFIGDHPLANINPTYAGHYTAGFSATTQIRRSDWGIKRTIPYVSDEIRITIETEMHREGGAPASASSIEKGSEPGSPLGASGSSTPTGFGNEVINEVP